MKIPTTEIIDSIRYYLTVSYSSPRALQGRAKVSGAPLRNLMFSSVFRSNTRFRARPFFVWRFLVGDDTVFRLINITDRDLVSCTMRKTKTKLKSTYEYQGRRY